LHIFGFYKGYKIGDVFYMNKYLVSFYLYSNKKLFYSLTHVFVYYPN